MPAPVAVRRAAALGLRVTEALSFLAPLLTRLVIGYAFYQAGGGKLANMERTVGFFTDLGIPFPAANAHFIARLEPHEIEHPIRDRRRVCKQVDTL